MKQDTTPMANATTAPSCKPRGENPKSAPNSVTAPAEQEIDVSHYMDCPHIDGWARMQMRNTPIAIPVFSAMKDEQLAIHIRAYQEGYQAASRHLKSEITRNFQLSMFGHVL